MAEEETDAGQNDEDQKIIGIQKIYMKDVSFETPNSPEIFTLEWQPTLSIDVDSNAAALKDDLYEVVLSLTATVKVDDKVAFLVEVQQAGIFLMQGVKPAELQQMHNVFCLRTLYPYAASTVADLVTKGGFPQLVPQPMNFRAMYQQRMEAARQAQAAEAE
ncbi:MAG: protein-export chaperone SecB [Pseudomonadota bacterium]